jgi:lipoteichoic acid synthase
VPRLAIGAAFLIANGAKLFLFNRTLAQVGPKLSNTVFLLALVASWEILLGALLLFRSRRIWALAFYAVQLAYLAINVGYFEYYNSYLSIRQAFHTLGEFAGIARNGSVPLPASLAIYLIDIPFLGLLVARPFHEATPARARRRRTALLAAVAALSLLYGYKYFVMIAPKDATVARSDRGRFVASFGLLPLQLSDFASQVNYEARLSPEGLPILAGTGGGLRRSVLLIQVEALDANVLAASHGGMPVMPFLRSLADRGRYFPRMLSYHKGGGTSDAEFSVLTSIEPLDDYAAFNLPGYDYPNTLPKAFKSAGYRTGAFHGNIGKYWNRAAAFSAMGFDKYWSRDATGLPESGWGVKDDDMLDFVAEKIGESEEPYFFLVLTMSSHGPYANVKRYFKNPRFDDVPSAIERDYLLSMAYVDSALERFMQRLGNGLRDSVLVIYGDHSEYYVPRGDWSFPRASVRDGPRRLEFVPCIVLAPGSPVGTGGGSAVLCDIAPTVLEASGIDYSFRSFGTDLLAAGSASPPVPFSGHSYSRVELARLGASTLAALSPEGR